jgi:cytochrome P450
MEITAPVAGRPVALEGIDLYDPDSFRSGRQHDTWQALRDRAPVWWHDRGDRAGFWCVTGHADCERVLKDHRTFSSEHGTVLGSMDTGDPAGGKTISLMDPPRHTVIRTEAMRSFSHAVVRQRAGRIRAQVRALAERCAEPQDFARLMRRLPMAVVGELMGIPEQDWDPIAFWTTAGLAPEDPEYAQGQSVAATVRRAHHELFARFSELIRHRRSHPGNDLITALVQLELDGRRMEDWTVLLNCYSFMAGANSTTPHVAAHTLNALIDHPDQWRAVAADPSLVAGLVEEGARWTSTPHHLVRRVRVDVELGGHRLAAGDWVSAWIPSANRDAAVFTRPYAFDPRRQPNPHLGFGVGPHYCIGAPVSRMALGILFEELTSRYEQFDRTGPVVHLYSNWINGLVSMPVLAKPRR